MRWIYTAVIQLYVLFIRTAALFGNKKARLWTQGRKNLLAQYMDYFANEQQSTYIWVHVSSLGEFEQGRTVIDELKKSHPEKKILLTFFSPSGYEIRKNYQHADVVFYLPIDRLRLMRKYVEVVSPSLVVFVKYDFWFNFLTACFEKEIPVVFISSVFRRNQYFFKWWAGWFRKQLRKVSFFFVQTQESVNILKMHGIEKTEFVGDTRLDRVISIREEQKRFPEIEKMVGTGKVIVAGSTWHEDENFLIGLRKTYPDVFFIIAPHDVSEKRVSSLERMFSLNCIRFSSIKNSSTQGVKTLIIDSIGVLAYIYRYATLVYVGNGFGKGIHNILEPVVYGKPVIFGPNYSKFVEAVTLVKAGGAFSFSNKNELEFITKLLLYDDVALNKASEKCIKYTENHQGATEKIMKFIVNL